MLDGGECPEGKPGIVTGKGKCRREARDAHEDGMAEKALLLKSTLPWFVFELKST